MYKRMTLKFALRYANCSKNIHENNVTSIIGAINDDVLVLNYRRIKIQFEFLSRKHSSTEASSMFLHPMLYKRHKYKKPVIVSRFKNRQYFRSNMNLLERRRFIKEFNKQRSD